MQPFQNFIPTMNNNYQMQMQNPYMDRMAQLQQYQQSLQPTQMPGANQQMNVIGKIVDSIDVVRATDVPMDGNIYYFPKADGTEIFGKQWLQNGQTRILTFKPCLDDKPNNVSIEEEKSKFEPIKDVLRGIQEDIKALTDKVDKISKPATSRSKKEVQDDAE